MKSQNTNQNGLEWQKKFDEETIRDGHVLLDSGKLEEFVNSPTYCIAKFRYGRGKDDYDKAMIQGIAQGKLTMRCTCEDAARGKRCRHMAAALIKYDEENAGGRKPREYVSPFKNASGLRPAFFDMEKMTKDLLFYHDIVDKAQIALEDGRLEAGKVEIDSEDEEGMSGSFDGTFTTDFTSGNVSCRFDRNGFRRIDCDLCNLHYVSGPDEKYLTKMMCEHATALLLKLNKELRKDDPGDETDWTAARFLRRYGELNQNHSFDSVIAPEAALLEPRLERAKDGQISLLFGVGKDKMYVIKNLTDLVEAVRSGEGYKLGKRDSITFREQTFTGKNEQYYRLIEKEVLNARAMNERLSSGSKYPVPDLTAKKDIPLESEALETFYNIAAGDVVEFTDKAEKGPAAGGLSLNGKSREAIDRAVREAREEDTPQRGESKAHRARKNHIRIGGGTPEFRITVKKLPQAAPPQNGEDPAAQLRGVTVTFESPVILSGTENHYFLTDETLSMLDDNTYRIVIPFYEAGRGCRAEFSIGTNNLPEFYYRIMPELMRNPYITVTEEDAPGAAAGLPPEARFDFFLDTDEDSLICRPRVTYGDDGFDLAAGDVESTVRRDRRQEERVMDTIKGFFPDFDEESARYFRDKTDDNIYEILNDGVNALLTYGDVHATEKFEKLKLRNVPQIQVGVKMRSNLLDMQVHPQELTNEELLELLESYRKKKKYHLLNNGTFISLEHQDSLAFIDELFRKLDVPIKDFVAGKIHLPAYRAYYLSRMLEEHEDVASDRDHGFRELVKDFESLSESDHDVPESLRDVMRPYQIYAYKWMMTLSDALFGGILADDMGLGKTLETISVLLAAKERAGDEENMTSLVVCPASLVYNWQMEFEKWAPEIRCACVAGTPEERERIIKSYKKYDVLITSYDLLKRDISLYEGARFNYQVVDEAQYIKNPGAAVSKAVKVIDSRIRFALTGTPIENRLSELWSIFDYLMPGFLYTYNTFRERFEGPVARGGDEDAKKKLKQMVAPFILRRLKEDVLSDLPEKNEEVQYAYFEKLQRELYEGEVVQIRNMINNMGTSGGEKLAVLAELTRLRQICCDPSLCSDHYKGGSAKRDAAMELIKTAVAGEHKVLLFSQFTSMLALLEKDLNKEEIPYYKIVGETPKEERLQLVRHFNDDDTPVFLISLKAGGTGLNLTGADVVIHYDPWWNLAAQNQATDRAHRIGQTKPVTVYKLIASATIEEKIMKMQAAKKDLAEAILSGTSDSLASLTKEELKKLL